jgi:DNA-binding MarR family transcriptional regulator
MAQLAYLGEGDARLDGAVPADVLAPTVSLFGNPAALDGLAQDARGAGLVVRGARPLESLVEGNGGVLGDIVVVACGEIGGAGLAALVRLDQRAARAGAQVIALTGRAALEDVFACCETAPTQILVEPTAAERSLALGVALARLSRSRVREMDEGDRVVLLRLTEEVGRLAAKLDALVPPLGAERTGSMGHRLGSPGRDFRGEERDFTRRARVPLPDARLVHRIIRQRRMRDRFFDSELFADPAWDILLDLTAARAEHRRVSVTSLCIAAAVPATTALRWIAQMTDMRILVREQDEDDRRRAFVALSDAAAEAVARYFEELGKDAGKLV